jgi:hypothetical protein
MQETKAFSRQLGAYIAAFLPAAQLGAYIAAFLPAAQYYKATDPRIAGVFDDQYTATLERLQETNDENFKNYMTRKTQAWLRRWGCPTPSDAAASPAPSAAPHPWRRGGRRCGGPAGQTCGSESGLRLEPQAELVNLKTRQAAHWHCPEREFLPSPTQVALQHFSLIFFIESILACFMSPF